MKPLFATLALSAALACLPRPAPAAEATQDGLRIGPAADLQAIEQHGDEWIAAFRLHDLPRLMKLYDERAKVALHGQHELLGKSAVAAFFGKGFATPSTADFRLSIERLVIDHDYAFLVSKYWYRDQGAPGSAEYRDAGRSVLVYHRNRRVKAFRGWQILVDMDQSTPDVSFADEPPASAAPLKP